LLEGEGIALFRNQNIYTGKFKKGMINGSGKMEYADGMIYEGKFVDDKREGLGEIYNKADLKNAWNFSESTEKLHAPKLNKSRRGSNMSRRKSPAPSPRNQNLVKKSSTGAAAGKAFKLRGMWKDDKKFGKTEKIIISTGAVVETNYYFEDEICLEKTLELDEGVYKGQVAQEKPFGYGELTSVPDETI
jgi:hypothetical protein